MKAEGVPQNRVNVPRVFRYDGIFTPCRWFVLRPGAEYYRTL